MLHEESVTDVGRSLRIELNAVKDQKIESQGYSIKSGKGEITIRGNDAVGAANGVYTLLRPNTQLSAQDVETICAAARQAEANAAGVSR